MAGHPLPRHVLRLTSVFEPPLNSADEVAQQAGFDPIGGLQNQAASLTRALDRRGIRQTVVTSRLGGPTSRRPIGQFGCVVRVGLPVRHLRQLWATAAVPTVLGSGPFDLVHVHQGEDLAALPLGLLAARRSGCPLVATLHCSVKLTVAQRRRGGVRQAVSGALEGFGLRQADRIITLTAATAATLGPLESRAVVIPSGVETAAFAPARPDSLFSQIPRPLVLYLGRLARQKDVPTLVRAFGLLTTEASLVIVGDGPERAAVDEAVDRLPDQIRARVYRFGFRPHVEVPGLLAAADLLVLPSVYEEMGSVLTEALQCGLPVVATRVGGIPHVVIDGETGVLVPPGEPAAMATAIERLLGDPALLTELRQGSLHEAGRYDWEALGDAVLGVYESVWTEAGRELSRGH